jgi:hypothetical protein
MIGLKNPRDFAAVTSAWPGLPNGLFSPGLPDGLFAYQKYLFGYILKVPWNEKCWFILGSFGICILLPLGIFYGHLVYLRPFGIF